MKIIEMKNKIQNHVQNWNPCQSYETLINVAHEQWTCCRSFGSVVTWNQYTGSTVCHMMTFRVTFHELLVDVCVRACMRAKCQCTSAHMRYTVGLYTFPYSNIDLLKFYNRYELRKLNNFHKIWRKKKSKCWLYYINLKTLF